MELFSSDWCSPTHLSIKEKLSRSAISETSKKSSTNFLWSACFPTKSRDFLLATDWMSSWMTINETKPVYRSPTYKNLVISMYGNRKLKISIKEKSNFWAFSIINFFYFLFIQFYNCIENFTQLSVFILRRTYSSDGGSCALLQNCLSSSYRLSSLE